ncbi:MAG: lysophospholipid acyltransferase family protein [Polyangiales bacterium]
MTERQRPKRPSKASKAAPIGAEAPTVAVTGEVEAKPAKVEAKEAKITKPKAEPKPAAPRAEKASAATAATDASDRATVRPKPTRKRTRTPPPPAPEPASPAASLVTEAERAIRDSIAAATVAPPARARPRPEPRIAVKDSIASGAVEVRVRPSEPTADDEIWTDGSGRGIEGAASRAQRAADKTPSEPASRLVRGSAGDRLREAAAFGSAQSLLGTDYYFRQYGAHGMRSLTAEVDEFGFDPHVDAKLRPLLELLCRRYFRVQLSGAENLPPGGRALLVSNRSGALPWDGLVLRTALRTALPELPLRWLAEDSVIHFPFMGVMMNRLGAVRACPENAERLLSQGRLVAVFPEGAQGSRKLFRDRYRLQRFGRGGYVKLALKFGVPILPTAIIGAEETNPVLGRSRLLGRFVGADSVPITPTFPWLGLAGLLPAPVRWRIAVGEPIDLSKYGPDSADDALVVHRLNEQIRASLQGLVDEGKSARGGVLFG